MILTFSTPKICLTPYCSFFSACLVASRALSQPPRNPAAAHHRLRSSGFAAPVPPAPHHPHIVVAQEVVPHYYDSLSRDYGRAAEIGERR